jgi:hypothetical protein
MTTCSPAALQTGVREAMAVRCRWFPQGLLSRLTGRALPGQAVRRRSRGEALSVAIGWTVAGVAGGLLVAVAGGAWWWLIPVAWAAAVHGARTLQVQMIHQAAHGTLIGRRRGRLNDCVGRVLSAVLLVEEFTTYRRSHLHLHHPPTKLSTAVDPTVRYLVALGLAPGLGRGVLVWRLITGLLNPVFHLRRVTERIGSHFCGTGPVYRAAVAVYLLGLAFAGWAVGWPVLVAWVIPLFPLYEIAAALRLCVEHEWPRADAAALPEVTHGVFCGHRPPAAGLPDGRRLIAWACWWAAMGGHALCRWLVLVGDTPCHDYHHDFPQSLEWPNEIELRQRDCDRRAVLGLPPRTEVWGLFDAIDRQFRLLSANPDPTLTLTE